MRIMCRIVTIASLVCLLIHRVASAPSPPVRLTIDCTDERRNTFGSRLRSRTQQYSNPRIDVDSICDFVHNALPKAVEDGRFLYDQDSDQTAEGDSLTPVAVAPPNGFISKLGVPKLKIPKLRIPKLNVPKLTEYSDGPYNIAPRMGDPMVLPTIIPQESLEESSAERMEAFKKGLQKMLRVVTVLGQIDQYFSERMRIIVEKLSKTFIE